MLEVSGTQHLPSELSPALVPVTPPRSASHVGQPQAGEGATCVPPPPSCHRHNVPNGAWLRSVPFSVALP